MSGTAQSTLQAAQPRRRSATPRAAAIAGILFAILYATSQLLYRLAVPEDVSDLEEIEEYFRLVSFALSLVPLYGIAFLWFIGVVRDRIGTHEDRLFATLFLGSGLLYLGLNFMAAALAGGLLAGYAAGQELFTPPVFNFGRTVIYQISNIYSLRMASIFVSALATILMRSGIMPRWFAIATNILALIMMFSFSLNVWIAFLFPAWVFVFSLLILIANYRQRSRIDPGLADTA